ncbi:hypothetical protein N657DRAFT_122023 [Parathielavia appendiculata]|uniref:Uncharacterized protein n=1 Tax=Parathielavia appendiculata TaxID=2587402 RepID=A0AAN6TW52_9PEZI|nr:hypothetical protein N657DRAFT_122023 [Parathielavia appendiculata]
MCLIWWFYSAHRWQYAGCSPPVAGVALRLLEKPVASVAAGQQEGNAVSGNDKLLAGQGASACMFDGACLARCRASLGGVSKGKLSSCLQSLNFMRKLWAKKFWVSLFIPNTDQCGFAAQLKPGLEPAEGERGGPGTSSAPHRPCEQERCAALRMFLHSFRFAKRL